MDLIDFAEKKADQMMTAQLEDMAILAKETNITFAFIVAAISAIFGYFMNSFDTSKPLQEQQWLWILPTLAVLMHLSLMAWRLVEQVMLAKPVNHPGNEPVHLLNDALKDYPVDAVRRAECINLQERIEKNRARNVATARELNNARRRVLLTPIIFLAVWAVVLLAQVAA